MRAEAGKSPARKNGQDVEIDPRAIAELDSKAIQANYQAIRDLVDGQAVLPMVKADGYGHGASWVAKLLVNLPDLYGFGVATLEEGARLRSDLGLRARRTRIVVVSGAAHWTDAKGHYCEQHGLTPVITSDADWHAFLRGGWPAKLPYELKFNTGMNRLGLGLGMARQVVKQLKTLPADQHPHGILSHLAMSEDASSALTRLQVERFRVLRSEMGSAFPSAQFHISNSGGIWNHKDLGLSDLIDVVRPGIALYGVPPWPGAPVRGIRPALTFKAMVIATHSLKSGEAIGYGAKYRVGSGDTEHAAILGVGYADGVSRALSRQGKVSLGGLYKPFLGVISMDLCAVACSPNTRVGEWAQLLGPSIDPWQQAQAAGTIPYELLTSLSSRVQRIYG